MNEIPKPRRVVPPAQPPATLPEYRYTRQFLREGSAFRQATWGPRFVALAIDFALISIPFNLLGNLLWLEKTIQSSNVEADKITDAVVIGLPIYLHYLLWPLVFAIYTVLATQRFGATLGNYAMNLKIVGEDGRVLGWRLLLARAYLLGYGLVSLGLISLKILLPVRFNDLLGVNLLFVPGFFLGLGCLWVIFDKNKQTLHDKIVKSRVVIADLKRI